VITPASYSATPTALLSHNYVVLMSEEIFGTIDRITFRSDSSGFTVAQLKMPKAKEPLCIVGTMPELSAGESIRCKGMFRHHPAHGTQFQVSEYQASLPTDSLGIRRYLEGGMVRGIGRKLAERIVDSFGDKTLRVFDTTPQLLLEVEGIGHKKLEMILASWQEQRSVREVMIFLQGHGVGAGFAHKIYRKYGDQAIEKVSQNPYRLATDITGIGFKSADQIAGQLGIPKDDPQRIRSGLEYVVDQMGSDGHTCTSEEMLIHTAEGMLGVPHQALEAELQFLKESGKLVSVVRDGQAWVWSRFLWSCEASIVKDIERILNAQCSIREIQVDKALDWVQGALSVNLAEGQVNALKHACVEKFMIITGGPGTGKSTITKALLTIQARLTSRIVLAAPTGRAAKRLSEVTGYHAQTIHSLLEIDFTNGGFKRGANNPLECDLIIIDEVSMVDTALMASLLKAIPSRARVLMVGDVDQLPSVGPGAVLKDLLESKLVPRHRLEEIFRQAAGSRIITSAHDINRGQCPDLSWQPSSDFLFFNLGEPELIVEKIVTLISQDLVKIRAFDPIDDIQVLAPMKRGLIGTENLNHVLQKVLNPQTCAPLMKMGRSFLPNDKVMQIRNNYEKGVFNGDVGRIRDIDQDNQELTVRFDDREICYDFADLDELVLAYAVSIHKYQGSETPCVVIPLHMSHYRMLQRNLLYTAVTRGKRCVVVVGNKRAMTCAVQRQDAGERMTGLRYLIDAVTWPEAVKS